MKMNRHGRKPLRYLFHIIVLVLVVIIVLVVVDHLHVISCNKRLALDKIPGGASVFTGFRFDLNVHE